MNVEVRRQLLRFDILHSIFWGCCQNTGKRPTPVFVRLTLPYQQSRRISLSIRSPVNSSLRPPLPPAAPLKVCRARFPSWSLCVPADPFREWKIQSRGPWRCQPLRRCRRPFPRLPGFRRRTWTCSHLRDRFSSTLRATMQPSLRVPRADCLRLCSPGWTHQQEQ